MNEKMPSEGGMDIIPSLVAVPFKLNSPEDRVQILQRGRPKFMITSKVKEPGKTTHQTFNFSWYDSYQWLCGSAQLNKLFCWPCLLMRPETSSWSSTGVDDVKKFQTLGAKHTSCKSHIKAISEYDGTLLEVGLQPEFIRETSAACKVEQLGSDSDSDHLGRFLAPKRPNPAAVAATVEETRDKSAAKETLTFQTWQQANRARLAEADPKVARRRRRLARLDITNAQLTSQKLRLEIQLLEAKLELQRALNASVCKDEVASSGAS